MKKQNLFTEEELAKVTDEAERKHLIECAQDQSKIDMKYMEIMSKYDLWEKGKCSRYFHATTHENAKKIMQDGVIRKGMDGGVYICKQPLEAARFVAIRGHETGTIFLGKQIQGGKRMNTPDARRIFEAIAMILSNRNDGIRVQLSEIKTKAAKAS